MNKDLRKKLNSYDNSVLRYDRKIVNLVWKLFHGADVEKELSKAEGDKAAFISQSGYTRLIQGSDGACSARDLRELELRRKSLLVDSVKSKPAVAEAYQKAAQAQYEFRLEVDGKRLTEGEAGKILSTEENRSIREMVWRSQEQSLALSSVKLDLVFALNEASGGTSFAGSVLTVQDCTTEDLFALFDAFKSRSLPQLRLLADELYSISGLGELKPWDAPFYLRKYLLGIGGDFLPKNSGNALELFKRTIKAMGFDRVRGQTYLEPDNIDKPPFTLSINGGEGYAPEECAISIAPGARDYRVFVNPDLSATGLDLTRTIFLETGRVIHYQALDRLNTRLPFRWDSDCMRHAIAMLFDSLLEDEKFLKDIAGLSAEESAHVSKLLRLKKLSMALRKAADACFEIELYRPVRVLDPGTLYASIQSGFSQLHHSEDLSKRWALNPHLALNPAGELSYFLGFLIYEKIAADIRSKFGGTLLHPGVAELLVDKYFTGYERPWKERV